VKKLLLLLWCGACTQSYTPKPKGYNRLDLPSAEYQPSPDSLPYQFEYSKHAKLRPYSHAPDEKDWVEIVYPSLHAYIHVTYKPLNKNKALKEFMNDAYKLTSKQQIKAYSIDEMTVKTPSGKTATLSEIAGDVPTQLQFTMTDSAHHFLRGALYFRSEVKNDSLAPAIDYMKREVMQFVNTLKWKKKK